MRSGALDRQKSLGVHPATLTVSGNVSDFQGELGEVYAFTVDVVQQITVNSLQGLTIHAAMHKQPYHRLPVPNDVAFFTGELAAVESGVAEVIVKEAVYHLNPGAVSL
jgi:hypothetical protein